MNNQQYSEIKPNYIRKLERPYTPEMEAAADRKAREAFWIYTFHLLLIPISYILESIGLWEMNRFGLLLLHVIFSASLYGPFVCIITLIYTLVARDRYPENRKLKFVTKYITSITAIAVAIFVIAICYCFFCAAKEVLFDSILSP